MCKKINSFEMINYAQISNINCQKAGNINLFIGENGTGKTTILKALYAAVRSTEEFQRGDNKNTLSDILQDNLRWTFQVDKLGDLVSKSSKEPLFFSVQLGEDKLSYRFSSSTVSKIVQAEYTGSSQNGNSIFIPAGEILSLQNIILKSREIDKTFGFDNTYYDLVKALRISPVKVNTDQSVSDKLSALIDGKVEIDEKSGKWVYKKGNTKYSVNITSAGVKKIAILERLLSNGVVNNHSILFIDEPEASLHPKAISVLMEVLDILANDMGIQIFLASHSYFVIKKLRILAMKRSCSIPCISLSPNKIQYDDLAEGMPDNSIIDESVRLYEEEINEVMG